jgi:hypothetical protein
MLRIGVYRCLDRGNVDPLFVHHRRESPICCIPGIVIEPQAL